MQLFFFTIMAAVLFEKHTKREVEWLNFKHTDTCSYITHDTLFLLLMYLCFCFYKLARVLIYCHSVTEAQYFGMFHYFLPRFA